MLLTSIGSGGSFVEFITVLLIFLFVLVVTFYVTKWIGKYQKTQTVGDNVEVIETTRISASACIEIVRIGERYVAIAVSKDNVTTLCELGKDEVVRKNTENSVSVDFANVLNKVSSVIARKEQNDNIEDRHEE